MRTWATVSVLAALSLLAFTSAEPQTFVLTGRQAEEVSVTVRFITAFNARRLREAVSLLTPTAVVSDCDYRAVKVVQFFGRKDVTRWLRERFADRDRLTVARMANQNPDQPSGAVGVDYSRRTSRTLIALGFNNGIKPELASKVVLTERPIRISRFANGPVGGSPESCRPRPFTPDVQSARVTKTSVR
jgi:hypothetical protein